MMTKKLKIAFLGGGNMAGALIEGLLKQGIAADCLHVIDINEQTQEHWRKRGLSVSNAPDKLLCQCSIWVLAVKPQQLREVVAKAKQFLQPDTIVLSIAAGISMSSLSQWLGDDTSPWPLVVRAMPNTPALVEKGMTGLAASAGLHTNHRDDIERIMGSVGEVVWVDSDAMIDAVTAVSGSGPAYVFRFIEAMMAAARELGLDEQQAKRLTLATLSGATALAAESEEPVSTLRERVTSKGGTTQAALDVMNQGHFFETIQKAMHAAHQRAGELSKEFGQTK